MSETRIPAETYPVGTFIAEELAARGWSVRDLAERMGGNAASNEVAVHILIDVDDEGVLLGEETAQQLSLAFGVSAQFFIALDKAHRLRLGWNFAEPPA